MIITEQYRQLARYNTWMNEKLYAVAATLDDAERRRDLGAWMAVTHFFNHETHHRGQATTLLMQLGRDPGVTDFAVFLA